MAAKKNEDQPTQPVKGKVRVDYGRAESRHASICLLQSTGDEVIVDFASHPLPTGRPNEAIVSVHTRMGMSYPTAKRLALIVGQAVARYEDVFGQIQADSQQRTAELLKKGGKIDDGTAKFPKGIEGKT